MKIKRDWDPYMIDTGKGLGVLTSIIGKWDGTGQDQAKGRGKDRGPIDRVPSTGEKSYHSK